MQWADLGVLQYRKVGISAANPCKAENRKLAFREIFKTKNLPMQWADLGSIAIPESRDQRS
ncbi:MAG: hypothetical protein IPP34_05035 [Bacteroidetes bacterium]|nr:hypothetical protein [Bacteroidota bacterium]